MSKPEPSTVTTSRTREPRPAGGNAVRAKDLRLFAGAMAGLPERTATLTLEYPAALPDWPALAQRLQARGRALRPQEPLFGVGPHDWPHAFVHEATPPASLAHWVVALTVALQRWARDPVWQGRVVPLGPRAARLALPWAREPVLRGALRFALRYLGAWLQPDAAVDASLDAELEAWLATVQAGGLAPSTQRFAQAAHCRDIPVEAGAGYIQLGWGCHAQRMNSSFTGNTGVIATGLARNKMQTSRCLNDGGIPVPPGALVSSWPAAAKVAEKLGWPVVVKPANLDQGVGVAPDIRELDTLKRAFERAFRLSPRAVIVERHVTGADHRLLVVGGQLRSATLRIPGGVTGDGTATVAELVKRVNAHPWRGSNKRSLLIALRLDDEAQACLDDQGLQPDGVPETGRFVPLRRTANISTGGTPMDVTSQVHPDNRRLAERAARLVGLDIAGVDFLCPDISRSWREVGGAVCEVNAQPGLRVHWLGDMARDINGEIVDWLFRDKPARIPTAAITGTNGKSTVARMLHHIWMTSGQIAGVCTTNGVWVGHELISDRNLSGLPGGKMLLADPAVAAAVIEMPRKGLIYLGHPCDRYDVAALLNVQDDHIGVGGIDTLENMARLKAEVLERASRAVAVNAEDPLCLAMRAHAGAPRHILVARDAATPALRDHRQRGGDAVFAQLHHATPWIVLAAGAAQTPLMPLADIPATMNGMLRFNELNALFATALAWAQGLELETIRSALASFANTPEHNPGRYNFIEGFPFQLLLDYGHNPDGVRELCELVTKLPVTGKRHLASMKLGNRHRRHVDELAPLLAQCFDSFVICTDADYVRRSPDWAGADPLQNMLDHWTDCLRAQGVAEAAINTRRDQAAAIRAALTNAQPGDLLVLLAEPWVALPILKAAVSESPCI